MSLPDATRHMQEAGLEFDAAEQHHRVTLDALALAAEAFCHDVTAPSLLVRSSAQEVAARGRLALARGRLREALVEQKKALVAHARLGRTA